jgi:predicted alpha/beta hydrolase family esterase
MKKAVILHSWFSTPNSNWYPWLKSEFEKKGYEVWSPEIPTMPTDSPDMETMLEYIVGKKFVDKDTVVIGHSLGSVLAMRLAEIVKFKTAILLSNWDYNDLTPEHQSFWKTPVNHALIKSNVEKIVCPISDNDPYVTKIIAHEMAVRLGATAIDVGPKGHFLTKDDGVKEVPEILEFV